MRRPLRGRPSRAFWPVAALVVLAAAGILFFSFRPQAGSDLESGSASTTSTMVPAAVATGISTTLPASTTSTELASTPPLAFDGTRAMGHIRVLAEDIGVRQSGGDNEAAAADYVATCLRGLGYAVETTPVPLPDGRVSHNVCATKAGASPLVVLVGAHLDSKPPAPGANDDASGVAVVLELARDLHHADLTATVEFVLFGAEEMVDPDRDHHHYGSRRFVAAMDGEERSALAGMISVDMVGYGDRFFVRTMGRGPRQLADLLLAYSTAHGLSAEYAQDASTYGMSDHEAFELAGYPAAWLEWRDDPTYHTTADTYGHCRPELVQRTGEMLLGVLTKLTEADLAALAGAAAPITSAPEDSTSAP